MSQGLHHNVVVQFLGTCDCPCHQHRRDECWCNGRRPSPHQIGHNDAVAHIGHCPGHGQRDCRVRTHPDWARAFRRAEEREQQRRIRRGQIRNSSDLTAAIRAGLIGGERRP